MKCRRVFFTKIIFIKNIKKYKNESSIILAVNVFPVLVGPENGITKGLYYHKANRTNYTIFSLYTNQIKYHTTLL